MPLYQYKCTGCEFEVEIRHSVKEEPGPCEKCGEKTLEKKIGFVSNITRSTTFSRKEKTGTATNRAIKDAKIDLEKQKKELKSK